MSASVKDLQQAIATLEARLASERQQIIARYDELRGALTRRLKSPKALLGIFAGVVGIGVLGGLRRRSAKLRRAQKPVAKPSVLLRVGTAIGLARRIWRIAGPYIQRVRSRTKVPTVPGYTQSRR